MLAGIAATAWGGLAFATDLLPPRLRYGYVHRATGAVWGGELPRVTAAGSAQVVAAEVFPGGDGMPTPTATCVLAADRLDVGGIGTVIEMLAGGLAAHGVRPVVVCHGDGARAARLRAAGVEVHSVADEASAMNAIRAASADVIQSHSAPPFLEQAARRSGVPLIPVMHNTEIHYTPARWAAFRALMAGSVMGIAVSATVRDFHIRQIGGDTPIVVVPNGAPRAPLPSGTERTVARSAVSRAIGVDLGADIVFACLARYDAQKNFAGLVAAFGDTIATSPHPMRLICAGEPSDRVEWRRSDAVRRAGPAAERIHLIGNSDARTLLTAVDAFVLDSFFEGWPVAATEAAAFGLPLLLSDVGGARELVQRDAGRSVLIPNASGDASRVSDRRVRAARRRSRRQPNAAALRDAAHAITATVVRERAEGRPPAGGDAERSGVDAMLSRHADLIASAAAASRRRPLS